MWKKFLAVMALAGVLMTSSASALDTSTPMDEFNVSTTNFDPSSGEYVNVTFNLLEQVAGVKVYVVNKNTNTIVSVLEEDATVGPMPIRNTWYGRSPNEANGARVLPDGMYTVKVDLTMGGFTFTAAAKDIEIESVHIVKPITKLGIFVPVISNLVASAQSFSPSAGETVTATFQVKTPETATATVTAAVTDANGNLVKNGLTVRKTSEILAATPTVTTYYITQWNGKNSSGNTVAEGYYTITVTAINTYGTDTETTRVYVQGSSVTPPPVLGEAPEVSALAVTPAAFAPEDGETTEIEFSVDKDAYLEVVVKSSNTVVKTFSTYDGTVLYDNSDFSLIWNGKDNDGNYVNDGAYTVYVTAKNSYGSDTDTKAVT
ncbi:MAG: hypothetical protein ABIH78_01890, partial [Candidatus Peregrinibacteria bacterium]